MFIRQAWAQDAATVSTSASFAGTFIQIIGIFLVFYLLLIRPQQKRLKQHEARLKALKVGDKVLSGGGLYAVVKKIKDDDITLELSKGFEVQTPRYAIREVLTEDTTVASPKKSKK